MFPQTTTLRDQSPYQPIEVKDAEFYRAINEATRVLTNATR